MAQRKNYTPEKKIQIVKNHLVDQKPLSDICDENGLHPTVYYRWQKNLFEFRVNSVNSGGIPGTQYLIFDLQMKF